MKNSKLALILDSFSKKEWKQFRAYVASPFFNKNDHLSQLQLIIEHHYFYLKTDFPTKKQAWKKLMPDLPYSEERLNNFISLLNKLAEDFVAYRAYESHVLRQFNLRLRGFNNRGLAKHFSKNFEKTEQLIKQMSYADADYYYDLYLLEVEADRFIADQGNTQQSRDFTKLLAHLDHYYLATKLKYYCLLINRKNIVKAEDVELSIREFLSYLQTFDITKIPVICLYHAVLMTLIEEEQETHFSQLNTLLDRYSNRFSQREIRNLYAFAQNYCIKKINAGQTRFLKALFELFKTLLAKKIIISEGILSPVYYKNIATVGLRSKEFEWVKRFIYDYKKYLIEKQQNNAFYYSLGMWHFYQKQYHDAMIALIQVDNDSFFYTLDAKAILLKSYYELDEEEAFFSLAHSFKIFVSRNKWIAKAHRQTYLNTIKYTWQLARIKKSEKAKLERLKTRITNAVQVFDTTWLLAKVEEKIG